MRKYVVIAALLFACAQSNAEPSMARSLQNEFRAVIAKSRPAVVNIRITQERDYRVANPEDIYGFLFGMPQMNSRVYKQVVQGNGSGVIIDPSGYIVTNAHVVAEASTITVTLTKSDGTEKSYPGKVTGVDQYMDLAVVKIDAGEELPYLKLSDDRDIMPGDWTIAIGSPFGLAQTTTVGVISAVRQTFMIEGRKYQNMIQTDAPINMGNSGGALLDIDGNVIGINTAIYSPSGGSAGIGFAIPAAEVTRILSNLEKGVAPHQGWVGVSMAPLTAAIVRAWHLQDLRGGTLVESVEKGSPADKAGLMRGDIITSCDDLDINGPDELSELVHQRKAGSEMNCKIIRKGENKTVGITLGELPVAVKTAAASSVKNASSGAEWSGIKVRDTADGVTVESVAQDSPLSDSLQQGDIIKGVNQQDCADVAAFNSIVKGIKIEDGVVFDILRQGVAMYISVKP